MDLSNVISFALVASLLVMSPGPNGLLIAKTVPISGKSAGFANIFGFVAAFFLQGSLSILGIALILTQSAQLFFIVKMLGAAYLYWIGIKAIRSAWGRSQASTAQKASQNVPQNKDKKAHLMGAFFEGFLTNALNPKTAMFYLAAFPQFLPAGANATEAFTLVFVHSLLNIAWFAGMVLLLAKLSNATRNKTFQKWLKTTTGVIFMGFGAKLAMLKP
ncbi:LysE family translocator [Marinomonas mediterranea]|uniref:LysE family translocator n=1 Tax=Marinomonas mediterranea TaxID=119864 RepID=UPI00234BBEAE|nr:LysE family translocator [Marinomonas mediterranea]WCN09596.1 LysE family transporter [Marinomonas mediterranea]